jgi:hypothetical protein
MAGYSGTPLVKKLGFKPGFRVAFVNAPDEFAGELSELPQDTQILRGILRSPLDLVILFVNSQKAMKTQFPNLAKKLANNGTLWVSWPKKSSGVVTDLSENIIRDIGLAAGLVDVKVCAVNEVWSGLKFVYRLRDRQTR